MPDTQKSVFPRLYTSQRKWLSYVTLHGANITVHQATTYERNIETKKKKSVIFVCRIQKKEAPSYLYSSGWKSFFCLKTSWKYSWFCHLSLQIPLCFPHLITCDKFTRNMWNKFHFPSEVNVWVYLNVPLRQKTPLSFCKIKTCYMGAGTDQSV
jgi:hypothetical protein